MVEGETLDGLPNSFQVGRRLRIVGDALESRSIPCITFFILLEEGLQAGLVFGGFLPYQTVANVVEQQSVVVFLNEEPKGGVFSGHFLSALSEYVLRRTLWMG